jgi:ribosome biogenesis GTP-binding protein YsxC/EngB
MARRILTTGTLSVRERLRRQVVPADVLEQIQSLGIARGRGNRPRAPASLGDRELGRLGQVATAHSVDQLPRPAEDEVAFAGRSNVGKSSLLNALGGKRIGPTSTQGLAAVKNSPGVTRSINFYGSQRRGPRLIDLPGYGFAFADPDAVAAWQHTMREFILTRGAPLRVLLVMDARQSLRQSDREFLLLIDREARLPLYVVMNKCAQRARSVQPPETHPPNPHAPRLQVRPRRAGGARQAVRDAAGRGRDSNAKHCGNAPRHSTAHEATVRCVRRRRSSRGCSCGSCARRRRWSPRSPASAWCAAPAATSARASAAPRRRRRHVTCAGARWSCAG